MNHPHVPLTPTAQPDHYQRETQRLMVEAERQRREIVILRKDLAAALTQYVRASIIVQNIGRFAQALQAQSEAEAHSIAHSEFDVPVGQAQIDLKIAIDNWLANQLGAPSEILERIDLLNKPIPEEP